MIDTDVSGLLKPRGTSAISKLYLLENIAHSIYECGVMIDNSR